jgi:hypothetical protein
VAAAVSVARRLTRLSALSAGALALACRDVTKPMGASVSPGLHVIAGGAAVDSGVERIPSGIYAPAGRVAVSRK